MLGPFVSASAYALILAGLRGLPFRSGGIVSVSSHLAPIFRQITRLPRCILNLTPGINKRFRVFNTVSLLCPEKDFKDREACLTGPKRFVLF